MKIFTLGPVEMYPETKRIGGQQVPYFRNAEFSEVMLQASSSLKRLSGAAAEDEVIVLTASGTAAMEAVVMNCFDENDRLLVIDGGTFGHRFVRLCEIHGIPHEVLKLSFGETLTREKLEACAEEDLTGMLVNIHESSTGQLYDLPMLSEFCQRKGMLFVVDAISSFLADEYDISRYKIDATILSSQKGLCLAPGLSFVILSRRMLRQRVEGRTSPTMYFDFNDYIVNGKRGQTPFTPAVRVVIELRAILQMFEEKGIGDQIASVRELAEDFRRRLREIGLDYPDYPLSNAVTPVLFDGVKHDAHKIFEILQDRYGYVVNPTGGELAARVFRVAHIGNRTIEDNACLTDAIAEIMKEY